MRLSFTKLEESAVSETIVFSGARTTEAYNQVSKRLGKELFLSSVEALLVIRLNQTSTPSKLRTRPCICCILFSLLSWSSSPCSPLRVVPVTGNNGDLLRDPESRSQKPAMSGRQSGNCRRAPRLQGLAANARNSGNLSCRWSQ
jgi:hypothetical protein